MVPARVVGADTGPDIDPDAGIDAETEAVDAVPPVKAVPAHISSTEYSRARMSAACKAGSAKMGKISSKRIPGEGKSGNWRRAARNFTLRLASSEAQEAEEVVFLPLGASSLLLLPILLGGSGVSLTFVTLLLSPSTLL